jgi:Branched-chain amino acid transport protein (AzlD)
MTAWITIAVLAVGTIAIKAAGPVALGRRSLPPVAGRVVALLAPSLLAALVAVETVTTDGALVLDARVAGLAAAGGVLALRRPAIVAVVVAAIVTALVRALS